MYIYFNVNPNGEHTGDCVIRAIALALDLDYYEVLYLLDKTSNYFNCDMLVKDCYKKLLTDDFKCPMIKTDNKTVAEVADDFKNNILILRIDGHLTCAKYGNIYDIWDCSNELVDIFWIVE